MGRKLGRGSAPFLGRQSGVPSDTKSSGSRLTSIPSGILIYAAIWPQLNRYGPNIEGLCPFGGGELDPHLTQCGQGWGLAACQVSLWSDQRHRQDRQTGQWSDSIGRTILQTVAQKLSVWESSCQYQKSVTLCSCSSGSNDKWDQCLRYKKASICWQDSAPPISGYWPTSEPNAG